MRICHFLFSIFLFSPAVQGAAEKEFQITEDLSPRFEIFKENILVPRQGQRSHAVHLPLDLSQYHGRYFLIESKKDYYIFINSKFAVRGSGRLRLNADSLQNMYSNSVLISFYQKKWIDDLSVKCALLTTHDALYNPRRPGFAFSNFILTTSLIIGIFFTALFHTNPQLTLDYLNFTKLFYLRDREENQITLRVTSSVNLLFYLFCSLLASLALITALHFSKDRLSFLTYSASATMGDYTGQWFLLALAILGVLMAKLAFVSLVGLLYGWRDVTGVQFFNFIRVLILSLTLIALVSLFCFSMGISVNYFTLLKAGCALLVVGACLLYFKLQARTVFRSFHLFSYLCATEIFPLVILIKLILF